MIRIGNALVDPQEISMAYEPANNFRDQKQICLVLRNGSSVWIDATLDEAEAALIDAGLIADPADDGPELSEEELGYLRILDGVGWQYLARDDDGKLCVFRQKPEKHGAYWEAPDGDFMRIDWDFDSIDSSQLWSIAYLLAD